MAKITISKWVCMYAHFPYIRNGSADNNQYLHKNFIILLYNMLRNSLQFFKEWIFWIAQ
jgi:hypothetical protein